MRIAIIQGHPDPKGGPLCHGLAEAYAAGAHEAGHALETIDVTHLQFPLLRAARISRRVRFLMRSGRRNRHSCAPSTPECRFSGRSRGASELIGTRRVPATADQRPAQRANLPRVLRRIHLVVGLAGVVLFLGTGQYMDRVHDHLRGMEDVRRMLFRSAHIYLLWSSLLNLALGLYFAEKLCGPVGCDITYVQS